MIDPGWRRIAGFQCQDNGDIAAVWLAHDKEADTIHLYDACVMREVPAVIAESFNSRGRWIPISWTSQEVADQLLERGCNTLPEAAKDSDPMASVTARDIVERMKTGRFKIDVRIKNWWDEFKSYTLDDGKVPRGTHPLMDATRHAVFHLEYARKQSTAGSKKPAYPEVAVI